MLRMGDNMQSKKKRRNVEIYESYWKFTAAYLDISGTKFNNCLNIIVKYIDEHKIELLENAQTNDNFKENELYKELQMRIVLLCDFKGKDASLSARKAINQFVKIGFVYPLLAGYHPLTKKFLKTTNKSEKNIIFSKIFYENSSIASDVTKDNTSLKHIHFLLKTLDKSGPLSKKDIIALMVTDITNYSKGYLTREELDSQYRFALMSEFEDRKYNQISHLKGYLKRFIDLKYDNESETFWFADDPAVIDKDFDKKFPRDNVKHRIYKKELKEESLKLFGKVVCYVDGMPYKTLIASHIKACNICLREGREDQAYDPNNGLLLDPTIDSYFDKYDITFSNDGKIIFASSVDIAIKSKYEQFSLDEKILNNDRLYYLKEHQKKFFEENGVL